MYYRIKGLQRLYLRAFLQLVEQSEKNPYKADLENTREGDLHKIQRKRNYYDLPLSLPAPKPKRDRKKPERLLY